MNLAKQRVVVALRHYLHQLTCEGTRNPNLSSRTMNMSSGSTDPKDKCNDSTPASNNNAAKMAVLILLVVQIVGTVFITRLSRRPSFDAAPDHQRLPYLNATVVVLAETVKLIASLLLIWREARWSIGSAVNRIRTEIIGKPRETLQVGIPALLYTIQTNLLLSALDKMNAALYQVTYQMKIVTTALISMILLKRRLNAEQWVALLILCGGVALIQLDETSTPSAFNGSVPYANVEMNVASLGPASERNRVLEDATFRILREAGSERNNSLLGILFLITACFTSGFAGVYFEKILKATPDSIWIRNLQLAMFGISLGLIGSHITDNGAIAENGFFQGYTGLTWLVISLQGFGGLVVAAVLKYTDNICKCFANAIATVLCCVLSYAVLEEFELTSLFFAGAALVVIATYFYARETAISSCFTKLLSLFNKRHPSTVFPNEELQELTSSVILKHDDSLHEVLSSCPSTSDPLTPYHPRESSISSSVDF